MIEIILAAALGAAIVASVWGVLALLRQSAERSARRAESLHELVQLQTALASSFRTLVMTDKPVRQPGGSRAPGTGGGSSGTAASPAGSAVSGVGGASSAGDNAAASRADAMRQRIDERREAAAATIEERRNAGRDARGEADDGPPPPPPRLLLDFDRERSLPRLEVVTTSPAVAVQDAAGLTGFVSPEENDGVRGAFEIEPGRRAGTYDVWYRVYDLEGPSPLEGRRPIGQRRVASGLTRFNVVFYKTIEGKGLVPLDFTSPDSPVEAFDWRRQPGDFDAAGWGKTPAARHFNHLPAYVEVEAETWQGQRARWLFEVKWIVTRAPDNAASAAAKAAAAAASGAKNQPARTGPGVQLGPDGRPVTELFGPDGRRR